MLLLKLSWRYVKSKLFGVRIVSQQRYPILCYQSARYVTRCPVCYKSALCVTKAPVRYKSVLCITRAPGCYKSALCVTKVPHMLQKRPTAPLYTLSLSLSLSLSLPPSLSLSFSLCIKRLVAGQAPRENIDFRFLALLLRFTVNSTKSTEVWDGAVAVYLPRSNRYVVLSLFMLPRVLC